MALLHYSPIAGTVEGEPLEIYPYLGSSRLEEPLSRYPVDVVFHGHAHHGTAEGRTMANVPVYNVSMALLQRIGAGGLPFKVVELPVGRTPVDGASGPAQGVQPDRRGAVSRRRRAGRLTPAGGQPSGGNSLPARHTQLGHRPQIEHLLQLLRWQQLLLLEQLLDGEARRDRLLGQLGRLGVPDLRAPAR